VKRAIERYGREILGVLADQLRSAADAAEVYSLWAEDLWRGLPGFQWRCSLRAWAHRLARNAAVRWSIARDRRTVGSVPIDDSGVRRAGGCLVARASDSKKTIFMHDSTSHTTVPLL
jgi:DNA-directed RNA polymerase specialized sigma24 family protein